MAINAKTTTNKNTLEEPRWLAVVASLAIGLIYAALPSNLSIGPRWLLLAVILALLIPTLISHRAGHHTADKMLGYLGTGILTIAMVWSIGLLVAAILKHEIDPKILLRSAIALWVPISLYLPCGTGGLTLAVRMSARRFLGIRKELFYFRR